MKNRSHLMSSISRASFGKMPDGKEVGLYTLRNQNGNEMSVMNYGGIITSLKVPDRNGNIEDVVLGYDRLQDYLRSNPFFGALIGRYGNRIAKGKFYLSDKLYKLDVNNGENHLHGGDGGFDKVYWNIEELNLSEGPALKLAYFSPDGEEGYPGNLEANVVYTLSDDNELRIEYTAKTDKQTIVNLTQHTYFNLSGDASRSILDHELMIHADAFLPVDQTLIPLGELRPVRGTSFDFTSPVAIGVHIHDQDTQLHYGKGYDHCWALGDPGSFRKVATLYDKVSGRLVEIYTTEPGLQFYSGNFLNGSNIGKKNIAYQQRYGLCLETQHYPDSPNQPSFPSVTLNPGEKYTSRTVYKFATR